MFASVMAATALAASQVIPRGIECQIIDALFVQQTASLPKIDPKYVRPPGHIGELHSRYSPNLIAQFISKLAAPLGAPDDAAKELASAVVASENSSWKPDCPWSTPPTGMVNAFSRPVVTRDGRLAVFEWHTGIDDPPANLGKLCLAYRPEKAWKINCMISWER